MKVRPTNSGIGFEDLDVMFNL